MPTITGLPQYFVGRKLFNAFITPLTLNGVTGVYTKGTTTDMASTTTQSVEYIRLRMSLELEEISSANQTFRNHVPVKNDFDLEVGELKYADGTGFTLGTWYGFDYFLAEAVISPDGGTTKNIVQAVCVRSTFDDEYGEGKSDHVLVGKSVGLPPFYGLASAKVY